ncbi:MAG: S8 family serine peptidase [Chitinophagaceae bacterium]
MIAQAVNQVVANGLLMLLRRETLATNLTKLFYTGVTNTAVIPTDRYTALELLLRIFIKRSILNQVLIPSYYNGVMNSLRWEALQAFRQIWIFILLMQMVSSCFGFNRSNLSGDPFEVCAFNVSEETNAKLMVVRASGTANVRFKYIIFRGDATILDYQAGTSSIVGHPNAAGSITVGAMLYADVPPFTPVWPGVASFSSRGGTSTLQNNAFVTRNKPDLIAPNGVNTTVNLGGPGFNDGDTYPNFFGTSAAAPHVAAVSALIMQGRKEIWFANNGNSCPDTSAITIIGWKIFLPAR